MVERENAGGGIHHCDCTCDAARRLEVIRQHFNATGHPTNCAEPKECRITAYNVEGILDALNPPPPSSTAENQGQGDKFGGYIDIVFDGPPSHESGRFVEVENPKGASINIGEWIEDGDLWRLRIPMVQGNDPGMKPIDELELLARVRELEGALGFYADDEKYVKWHRAERVIDKDGGKIARRALGKEG